MNEATMRLCSLTREELATLRGEVSLCSLYYSDYENSLDINKEYVCAFFDWFADWINEQMFSDDEDEYYSEAFWGSLAEYDTIDNLEYFQKEVYEALVL